MIIKVLGPGCAKCKEAATLVNAVVAELNATATVEKVTDLPEIMRLGVLSTPAVVIDGAVKCTGRIPTKDELVGWITGA